MTLIAAISRHFCLADDHESDSLCKYPNIYLIFIRLKQKPAHIGGNFPRSAEQHFRAIGSDSVTNDRR